MMNTAHMLFSRSTFALMAVALLATSTQAQLGSRLNALLGSSASPAAASTPAPASTPAATTGCPISSKTTTLDFSKVAKECPSAGTSGTDFCGPCICALTETYMPALKAAGILPLATTADAANFSMDTASKVIAACTSQYLAPALAAQIDITGLSLLSTKCEFSATNVPDCLSALIFTNSTPQPTVKAADGMTDPASSTVPTGDYQPDTTLNSDLSGAVGGVVPGAATPTGSVITIRSNATPTATPTIPVLTPAKPATGSTPAPAPSTAKPTPAAAAPTSTPAVVPAPAVKATPADPAAAAQKPAPATQQSTNAGTLAASGPATMQLAATALAVALLMGML